MTTRTDVLGNVPTKGCTIIWNPPRYKGLVYGKCVGFAKSGLPLIQVDDKKFKQSYCGIPTQEGYFTPKTGFAIGLVPFYE